MVCGEIISFYSLPDCFSFLSFLPQNEVYLIAFNVKYNLTEWTGGGVVEM